MKRHLLFIILIICRLPAWSQSAHATNISSRTLAPVQPKSTITAPLRTIPLDTAKMKMMNGRQHISVPADRSNAQLLDVTGVIISGGVVWDQGKDGDTHWSFGLFDHNDKPIASFHDDSDNDEYNLGNSPVNVRMKIDNPAQLKDFIPIGRIHVNIAPNGHDTWAFDQLKLTFDFSNPSFSMQVTLSPGILSEDHRDVDMIFDYDGQNFQPRQ